MCLKDTKVPCNPKPLTSSYQSCHFSILYKCHATKLVSPLPKHQHNQLKINTIKTNKYLPSTSYHKSLSRVTITRYNDLP